VSGLRLFFLGPPRFERNDQPIDFSVANAIALLAYLVLTRSPQPRDHLLALLWPASPGDAARKNLRNTLWTIRKSLGDDVLHADEDRLTLRDDVWIDVDEFEQVADSRWQIAEGMKLPALGRQLSAIGLYHGPLLDSFSLSDAPEFEIWLIGERERVGQAHLRLLSTLVEAKRAEGNWRDVIALAHRALAADNLQEPMYRALMEAHARLGERAEATRQYEALRVTLARELGVEPLSETTSLRDAILRSEVQPPLVTSSRSPLPKRQWVMGGAAHAPFVGHQAEFAALDEELQASAAGRARAVLLTGELGIGKTRLWREWSATLSPDLAVLEGHCLEATQSLPFTPLVNLFSHRAHTQRLFGPHSPVPAIWLAEVERYGNLEMIANYRAKLGRAARGRGDLDEALVRLEEARQAAAKLLAMFLQTQIDLWLTELHLERGERAAANEALRRAKTRLTENVGLRDWAERVQQQLG